VDRLKRVLLGGAGLLRSESGQTLTEYALVILLVAVALVGVLGAFRGDLGGFYQTASSAFP
jgi:Flp pilus assembly pilin Flp